MNCALWEPLSNSCYRSIM